MEIDYDAPDTPYRQIAAWIRGRITSGELQPGRKVPSESDLTQSLGVARTTARRAYRLLAQEGWIYTVPGRGSFVSAQFPGELSQVGLAVPGGARLCAHTPGCLRSPVRPTG